MVNQLEAKLKELEENFEKLTAFAQKKQEDHAKEMADIEAELLKMQGEYRGLANLRESLLAAEAKIEE